MCKKFRITAFVLTAALLFDTIMTPVYTEQGMFGGFMVQAKEKTLEITVPPSDETEISIDETGLSEESIDSTEESESTTDETELPDETTDSTEESESTTGETELQDETTESTEEGESTTDETELPDEATESTEEGESTTDETELPDETTEFPTEESTDDTAETEDVVSESVVAYSQDPNVVNTCLNLTLEQVGLTVSGDTITVNSGEDLVKLSHVNPDYYKDKTLRFVNIDAAYDTTITVNLTVNDTAYECNFAGLNSFQGTISVAQGSENYAIKLVRPLFGTLSDKAKIVSDDNTGLMLMFVAKTNEIANDIPTALLAETVKASGTPASTPWQIRATASDKDGIMPPLIGTMELNAQISVSLDMDYGEYKVIQVKGTNNAGLLCAKMGESANLTINSLKTATAGMPAVTATSGDAGSLVGNMASGAILNLGSITDMTLSNVTASGCAGGLVGSATDVVIPQISLTGNATISGATAGGLIGSYSFSGTNATVTAAVTGVTVIGTSGNAGGIFGNLNNAGTGTIEFQNSATVNVTLSTKGNAGGLIGQYSAGNLDASLLLKPGNVNSTLTGTAGTANTYGGFIGWVEGDSAAYIEAVPTGTVTVNGTSNNYGGLIGSLSDHGHYLKIGSVTIQNNGTIKGNTTAGGLVGLFSSGVLELSGAVSTQTPACGKIYYRGNYVGRRENTLVFTSYQPNGGWEFNKNDCNDIGNWGQVLQVYDGSGLEGLLDFTTSHKVSVTGTNADVEIRDKLTFAQTALRFQLNSIGALIVNDDFNFKNDNVSLSLSGEIDLDGTGLTGFQRDDSKAERANVTLNCNLATIQFPNINIWGGMENNDNVAHNRQGLFAETGSLTVNNENDSKLTLNGSISVVAFNKYVYLGALTADSSGDVTAANVICNSSLTITSDNKGEERISGLVAQQNGGTVTFTGCEWKSKITYNGSNICYLGGLLARAENGNTITVNNCTIRGSITKTGSGECFVGGLVASLRDHSGGGWKNYLTIKSLTADCVTINTPNCSKTGGILGWEWMTETTEIRSVTVKNCTLNGGSGRFGGLVYKGSGYWKVYESGIKFESGNSFTGASSGNEVSGLLLADGRKLEGHNNALYLEIQNGAYTIDENSVTMNIDSSMPFDEIVGMTEGADGNGIVSIGTGINVNSPNVNSPAAKDCNYKNQLSTDYENPHTRYYYNLDVFRISMDATGEINNSGKLVLYSAYTHCYSGLQKYFYSNPGIIKGTLDLTGYSYYPAEAYRNIENAEIKFDYSSLENNTRYPSDEKRQNYGMHTGLFTDVVISQSATEQKNMNVTNLTLSGTVGGVTVDGVNRSYGALIRGNAQGGNTNAKLILAIDGVTLNNLSIYPQVNANMVAPLLLYSIGNYTTMNMSSVVTIDYAENPDYAASSLIGNVGSETGSHIQLTFSDMVLGDNIFSRAWFLESFQYSGDSSGVYNFTNSDDSRYTLGQELSNTDRVEGVPEGPSGRNNGQQYCFFDDTTEVCKVVGGESADPTTYFNDYLRYVYQKEEASFHELDINLSRSGLIEGCGTFYDPYIISTAKQLGELANVLNDAEQAGMQIQVDSGVLNGSTINGFKNSHAQGATGTHITYTRNNNKWQKLDDDTTTVSDENIKLYLRNAYYKISDDITLMEWTGLGASEASAFCGVIDGGNNTITIDVVSGSLGSQFGGIIKFSMGSVVKNLTVNYTGTPTVSCDKVPNSTTEASFFGGVVGWCLGGDTILDNISVTGLSTPSVTGTNPHLAAVGGYVGMVGGAIMNNKLQYGGGVVFRGNVGAGLSTGKANANSKYFYVNPYVGRVLDGYAMSENQNLDNTDKNYKIPCISDREYLTLADSTITVSGPEGLWLLSAIVNSGAGAMQTDNCLAYNTGKARTGDYNAMTQDAKDDEAYLGGEKYTGDNGKTKAYLFRYVNVQSGDLYNVCSAGVSISLTGNCDMSGYGNGFRGIGGCYGNIDSADRLLKVVSISSPENSKYTITLQQNRREYTDEYQNWTTLGTGLFPVLNPATEFSAERLTLAGSTGITYYNNSNNGIVAAVNPIPSNGKLMDADNNKYRLGCSGAGLLAGTMKNNTGTDSTITLNEIKITRNVTGSATGTVTGSATFAGGLIGLACINNSSATNYIKTIAVVNCNYENPSIEGFACVGGFFGYVYADSISITATSAYPMESITIQSNETTVEGAKTGIGTLIGRCGVTNLTIKGEENNPMVLSGTHTITNQNQTTSSDKYFSGGLAGLLGIRDKGSVNINNIEFKGTVTISNSKSSNSSGTLAGAMARYQRDTSFDNGEFDWGKGGDITANISNIQIAQSDEDSVTVKNTKQGGALFGYMLVSTANIRDIHIGSDNASVTLAAEAKNDNSSLSGMFGTVSNATATLTNVFLTKVNIWGLPKNSSRGVALLVGYADNHATFNMKNAKLKDCNVAVNNANANTGFIFAELSDATVNGYNILIDGCTVGLSLSATNTSGTTTYNLTDFKADNGNAELIGLKSGNTYKPYSELSVTEIKNATSVSYVALFGGNSNSKDVKLVGVSVQNCKAPMKDFARNKGSNSYIIRADYTGSCMGESPNTAGALSPYVTVNSVSPLTIPDVTITGDGAVFSTGTTEPLLKKILAEDRYYNIDVSKEYIANNSTGDNSTVTLTHFADKDLNTFEGTDFPVIVLQTNSSDEANRCLHSIISSLTNWELCTKSGDNVTVNQGSFYSLSAVSYRWNGSAFERQDNKSLYVNGNRFYLKPGGYDNKLLQFTLVDVAYKDPSKPNGNDFYHLYIPVVVKKMFEYKFWASAKLGTTYSVSSYESLSQPVIASHGETITALLSYEYQWSKEEWTDAMENGQDLLWNFDLGVLFKPYNLSAGTEMTLVDRNYRDQAYFASAATETNSVCFKDFKKGEASWNADRYLCDDLKLTAQQNNTGKYFLLGVAKTQDATLRDVDGKFYRLATTTDDEESRYELTINGIGSSGKVTAQFYLTLHTPLNAAGIVNTNVQCSDILTGKLPTRRLPVSKDRQFTQNGSENKIVLGDFFTQESSVTTTRGEEKITEINEEIPLELTTTISFSDETAKELYRQYAAGQRLYQKFEMKLAEYVDNISQPKDLVQGTQIRVQYYLGEEPIGDPITELLTSAVSSYPMEFLWTDGMPGLPASDVQDTMQLKAKILLTYLPAARTEQFPTRNSESSRDGIAVVGSSSLAYSLDSLRNNTNINNGQEAKCDEMVPHFYREDVGAASLNYVAYENQNDIPAESVSELGINGRDGNRFTIHSAALYNVSQVMNVENADTLRVTVSLLEKQEASTYNSLYYEEISDLQRYLSSLEVKAYYKQGDSMIAANLKDNSTFDFSVAGFDPEVPLQIPITLDVLTGEGFEGTYANYRIKVTAQLMQGNEPVGNSIASDYIVYTNAKICQSFIDIGN